MSNFTQVENGLNPSPVVYLFKLDFSTTKLGINDVLYWSPYRNGSNDISFGGQAYQYVGSRFTGMSMESGGKLPAPNLTFFLPQGNILGQRLLRQDVRGLRVTRLKTFADFLDGGQSPDGTAFRQVVFYVNSLDHHEGGEFSYNLSTNYGLEGMNVKANRVLNTYSCINKYRVWDASKNDFTYTAVKDGGCPWGNPDEQANYPDVPAGQWGKPFIDGGDNTTDDASKDRCSLGAAACVKRFCQSNTAAPIPWLADPKGMTKDTGACS